MRKSFPATILFAFILAALAVFSACGNQSNPNRNANAGVIAEPTPDKAAIEAQLKALEYDWPRIVKERDGAAVRRLEADDIMLVYPDGSDGAKDVDIKDIESGALADDPQEVIEVTVNVLDNDSAVVRSRTRVKGDNYKITGNNCQTTIHEFRIVDMFMRRNDQWQIVASATVPVTSPAAAATPATTPGADASPKAKASPSTRTSPTEGASPKPKTEPE
ncbi:MAG TPA: nuclear transport factor 2 family protein [Pyrinomonadaceae bacterium]|nr:nuclear transport factor 2 family protein [Pyrinomonadaceae bacterium]